MADLGGRRGCAPPGRPNSFDFMQFSGKFGKNRMLVPPLGSWRPPPPGKSWIRRWHWTNIVQCAYESLGRIEFPSSTNQGKSEIYICFGFIRFTTRHQFTPSRYVVECDRNNVAVNFRDTVNLSFPCEKHMACSSSTSSGRVGRGQET